MILSLSSLLFVVYVVIRLWIFGQRKEWKDFVVFALISIVAGYFLLVHMLSWNIGHPLTYLQRVVAPAAHAIFPRLFGIDT